QERLEREYGMNIITTAPSVKYRVTTTDKRVLSIENPSKMPNAVLIEKIEEPFIMGTIHTPAEYVGAVIALCESRRGQQQKIDFITSERCAVVYKLPLGEMVFDFYDRLKSSTKGYASFEYEILDFEESDRIK